MVTAGLQAAVRHSSSVAALDTLCQREGLHVTLCLGGTGVAVVLSVHTAVRCCCSAWQLPPGAGQVQLQQQPLLGFTGTQWVCFGYGLAPACTHLLLVQMVAAQH